MCMREGGGSNSNIYIYLYKAAGGGSRKKLESFVFNVWGLGKIYRYIFYIEIYIYISLSALSASRRSVCVG